MNRLPRVTQQASNRAEIFLSLSAASLSSGCFLRASLPRAKGRQPAGNTIDIHPPPVGSPGESSTGALSPDAPFFRSLVLNNCFLSEPRPVASW